MKDKQANGVKANVNDLMYSNMQTQMVIDTGGADNERRGLGKQIAAYPSDDLSCSNENTNEVRL